MCLLKRIGPVGEHPYTGNSSKGDKRAGNKQDDEVDRMMREPGPSASRFLAYLIVSHLAFFKIEETQGMMDGANSSLG
jgi:hypothetical protein